MKPRTKPTTSTINNIQSLPFIELAELCRQIHSDKVALKEAIDDFAESYGIKARPWVYPQILAHIGKWTLSRNESELISAKQLLADNVARDAFNQGIYFFAMSNSRALDRQTQGDNKYYCGLVPLILAAHKKMNGIKYSEWDRSEIHLVVNQTLAEAMLADYPEYTRDELLRFRVEGLTVKTGARAGTVGNPISTPSLNGLEKYLEDGRIGMALVPKLARIMLCQTWCAHPTVRNEYCVLDPKNWDRQPEPLVLDDPIQTFKPLSAKQTKIPVLDTLPWM